MEELGGSRLDGRGSMVRKKRSQTARRPRPEPQVFGENHDSPLSSVPHSDDTSKVSSDEQTGDTNFRGKMFSLNQCMSRAEDSYSRKKIKRDDDNGAGVPKSNGNSGDHDIPSGGHMKALDSIGKDSKLKKVKLKVGGVTRTIQAKSNSNSASSIGTSTKAPKSSDGPRAKPKSALKDIVDNPLPDKKMSGAQRVLSRGKSQPSKEEETGRMATKNGFDNQSEVRKSKRVPKRRVLDDTYDDEIDEELRFLEKMKTPKVVRFDDESIKKQRNNSRNYDGGKYETLDQGTRSSKDGKRSRSDQGSDDTDDYEEVVVSDSEAAGKKKKKKLTKDKSSSPPETKREIAMTTRQRALYSVPDANQIEFPNGLPPAPSRKKIEQLTETEQQVKKAEAAQRRKMLTEKANSAHHEETVKKVLGQDSSRKKREDKAKKRQVELAQARAADAQLRASSTVRWIIGPTGTYIHFPEEMGLPKLFDSKPISYPPPREKCAGPSCNNPFKYRDSKTKLPLCSLQCYKAVQTEMPAQTQC